AFPSLNTTYRVENGTPTHVQPAHVNLGLAIDVERKGKRSLVVPNIKGAETCTFAQFLGAYNALIRKSKDNSFAPEDFAGTTASITNPGMIGTTLSVPRLMPGQGVIIGVGSIGFPPEYYGMAPEVASRAGLSEVMTLTSTYDHRVIQGAESGAFLAHVVELLLGRHGFYDEVFGSLGILHPPFRHAVDTTPVGGWDDDRQAQVRKEARVLELIRSFRVRGHLQANVNPLGYEFRAHPELDPATYGLTVWDLDRTFITGGLGGRDEMTLREILDTLRETYTGTVGTEFMHITSVEEKQWLMEQVEGGALSASLTTDEKKRMLDRLNAAEAFETFLHTKYVGQKRFSLQGADATIPFLDGVLNAAARSGVRESVIGMAHRGRLNVLANTLGKSFSKIFGEFEGNIDPSTMHGSGDVKYHLGMTGTHTAPTGETVGLLLAANPSHLEAVDPVVEGMTRARQDVLRESGHGEDPAQDAVLPILIHGDAAFAGQGVVPETLNLSLLRGYKTGGTIHLVINNQIGFTTIPADARSTTYATDVARMVQAPIFHVNGDDPEAVLRVARLAFAYRQTFNKDVVVDLLCYRVYGHNEGDEPTYTQPVLYRKIQGKRTPRLLYTERLVRRGDLTAADAEAMMDSFRARLTEAFEETRGVEETEAPGRSTSSAPAPLDEPTTAVSREALLAVTQALMRHPEDFAIHPKLERQFARRGELFEAGKIDWGFGEALAFGTLVAEGTPVRITGQDSRRGTFSHRHAVLYDQNNGAEFIPLNHIREGQAQLLVYDSSLSE
ncbi:MAG TPA: multifunctional oxoglutarate decarboxylase/oxoglutarate dehydrogenase thiamine pyrophosphate-binding subunit/dihydrolipoyllysine-residue succinyltransferase subunit, partial [Rhodothermales bacterium]|nr:multifunctional oxoglutarate decarboxylase/oxoglutarate dehydrogenase thiamine pyrophosphate-binding subunit/dihydrolipoyllysine-residue succinyltransferase subunit [Rhodothermales bacterium]